jgi:hypothetical protein
MISFSIGATSRGWTVCQDGRFCATYDDGLAALYAAIQAAQYMGSVGPKRSRVVVDGQIGSADAIAWEYGDPVPVSSYWATEVRMPPHIPVCGEGGVQYIEQT